MGIRDIIAEAAAHAAYESIRAFARAEGEEVWPAWDLLDDETRHAVLDRAIDALSGNGDMRQRYLEHRAPDAPATWDDLPETERRSDELFTRVARATAKILGGLE